MAEFVKDIVEVIKVKAQKDKDGEVIAKINRQMKDIKEEIVG